MARYWVSGTISTELGPATASVAVSLLGTTITSGRTLWLTGVVLPTTTGIVKEVVNFYDGASGVIAATASDLKKLQLQCPNASDALGSPLGQVREFPMPGLKFSTGCVVMHESTEFIYLGDLSGMGYEV